MRMLTSVNKSELEPMPPLSSEPLYGVYKENAVW